MKKSALHKVAKYGRLEVVKDLIENGANPNLEYENRTKNSKYTPLELAILGGHLGVVEYLIDIRTNVHFYILFNMASQKGNMEIVEIVSFSNIVFFKLV